jgi:hypothetical protein
MGGTSVGIGGAGTAIAGVVSAGVLGALIGHGINKGYEAGFGESIGESWADAKLPGFGGRTLGRAYYCRFINPGSCGSNCP